METVSPVKDVEEVVKEAGGASFKLCYQCGLCNTVCPVTRVKSFLIRSVIRETVFGLSDFEAADKWMCVTCRSCVARCPRGVEIIDVMRSLRRTIADMGVGGVPDSLRLTAKNISAVGNPTGDPVEKRSDWAKTLNVKTFTAGTEFLYYSCCTPAYVPSVQRINKALVNTLQKANIDFGVLGNEQVCCGESVRKSGHETLFQTLSQTNSKLFIEAGVKKIVASSPHCFETFQKEYPDLAGKVEVMHITQFLHQLIKEGRIKFTKEVKQKVTYHDPCYLGRHNGIYDQPREILKSIPGLELVEMADNRENSLCCGGGGGGIWLESKKGERLSDMRLEQAIATGAGTLALACPYCMLNFDDSVLTSEKGGVIQIKDITELVQEAL